MSWKTHCVPRNEKDSSSSSSELSGKLICLLLQFPLAFMVLKKFADMFSPVD